MKAVDEPQGAVPTVPWSGRAKLGAGLVALSFLPWLAVAALPFMADGSLPWGKAAVTTALVVAGEVIQLAGIALAGPDLWIRVRSTVRKWTSKRSP